MASDKELEGQLLEAGGKLVKTPTSADELLQILNQVESCLSKVEQSPSESMTEAVSPLLRALVADQLLRHSDVDVRVAVAACLSEITRISAPEAPYDDDQMKEVFKLIVSAFENLSNNSSQSYAKRMSILETVAKVRSCVVMLDLECDTLIIEMFQHFLRAIRDYHPENVFSSMETIMSLVLEESEDISPELLFPLLDTVKKDNAEVLPVARKLAEQVLNKCASKIQTWLVQAVKFYNISLDDYSEVVASICQETSTASEQNEIHDGGKQPEVSPSDQVNARAEKSPKPVVNNGVAQAGEDSSSLKKVDEALNDLSKIGSVSNKAALENTEIEKEEHQSKPEETTKKSASKPNSSSSGPDGSHTGNERGVENELDKEEAQDKECLDEPNNGNTQDKDVSGEPGSDKIEDKEVPVEADSEKTQDKEVPGQPGSEKTQDKEVSNEADIEKTEDKEVSSQPDNEKTQEEVPSSPDSEKTQEKEASRSVENEMSKEEKVANSIDNQKAQEKKVPDSPDSEETEDEKLSAGTPMARENENEHESTVQISSPKNLEGENASDVRLSPSENLPDEKKSKKDGRTKKESLKEVVAPANDEDQKVSKETSEIDRRPRRILGKKAPLRASDEDKGPITDDMSKESKKTDSKGKQKQSGRKGDAKKSSAKEDKEKRSHGKAVVKKDEQKSAAEDGKRASAKDDHKETVSSLKSSKKLNKDDDQLEKTPRLGSKGKRKAPDVKEYGENLVGRRIKVLWPDDQEYYPGGIESFDPVKKKHRVVYDDGDVEILNLKGEIFEFLKDEKEEVAGVLSPDASSGRPKNKKVKSGGSSGKGGASSSKSKGAAAKSSTRSGEGSSAGGKTKGKTVKSDDDDGGRTKDRKSGGKVVNVASKTSKKPKDDRVGTPKSGKTKDRETVTLKTTKPQTATKSNKQDPPKTGSKSKGKRPRSSGKSDVNDDSDPKSPSLKGKGGEKKGNEKVKAKSPESSDAQTSESKFGRKRRKVVKG